MTGPFDPPFDVPEWAPPNLARELAAMPEASRALLLSLRESPDPSDIDELLSDPAHWEALARIDTRPWLVTWFSATTDWELELDESGPIAGLVGRSATVATAWTFGGVHDKDTVFNGLPATNRDVLVRGVSLLGVRDRVFRIRRYVDWVGLFGQLGLTVNWRVPMPATPDPVP